ncbi:imelysin family protein [Rhodobacterales bacterium]|nr:imelysin family protein [Rhodobacterales bacterium]
MRQLALATLAIVCAGPVLAQDFEPPLERLIDGYIRPSMSEFAETAGSLPGAVDAVCAKAPEKDAQETFRIAFAAAVEGFSKIHFLRFGPLLEDDRLNRLAFLPDPRGAAQRQIRKIYAKKDETVLSPQTISAKSVAVQGLTALQLIAFDKNSAVRLAEPDDDREFTCGYARSIAENIAGIAADLASEWDDPDGYAKVLLTSSTGNERFHTSKEAIESVFNTLVTGLIIVRDQDLLPALGSSQEDAKAYRFPFSRSGNSVVYMKAELQGIRDALFSMNLMAMTPEKFHWIYNGVDFEFSNAQGYLDNLQSPLRQTFEDGDGYAQVSILAITVKSIRNTLATEMAGALQLAGGFNALDGD